MGARIAVSQHAQGAVTMIARASPWIFIRERLVPRTGALYARSLSACQEWRGCPPNCANLEQIWTESVRFSADLGKNLQT